MGVLVLPLSHLLGILKYHLALRILARWDIASISTVVHAHIQVVVLVMLPLLTARVQYVGRA